MSPGRVGALFVCGFVERGGRWRGKARERGFHRLVSFDELWSFGGRWSGDEVYEVRLVSLNESLSRKYSLSTRILLRRTFSFNEHPHQQIFFNEHPHPTNVLQRISSCGSAMVVHQNLVFLYEMAPSTPIPTPTQTPIPTPTLSDDHLPQTLFSTK